MTTVSAESISDTIVEPRTWGQEKHNIFLAFVEHEIPDNNWNKKMLKENIKNYNIETKIGHDDPKLMCIDAGGTPTCATTCGTYNVFNPWSIVLSRGCILPCWHACDFGENEN